MSNKRSKPHWHNWKWWASSMGTSTVINVHAPFGEYAFISHSKREGVTPTEFRASINQIILLMDAEYAAVMSQPQNINHYE